MDDPCWGDSPIQTGLFKAELKMVIEIISVILKLLNAKHKSQFSFTEQICENLIEKNAHLVVLDGIKRHFTWARAVECGLRGLRAMIIFQQVACVGVNEVVGGVRMGGVFVCLHYPCMCDCFAETTNLVKVGIGRNFIIIDWSLSNNL